MSGGEALSDAKKGWYADPDGSKRLRYWDGGQWTEGPVRSARQRYLWLAALVAVIVVGIVAYDFFTVSDQEKRVGAIAACKSMVKDRLKSPATAKFSDESVQAITGYAYEMFDVRGSVDAENGFSALVRNHYECEVEHRKNDFYLVMDLKFQHR